jgi:hypothetical protein
MVVKKAEKKQRGRRKAIQMTSGRKGSRSAFTATCCSKPTSWPASKALHDRS